MPAASLTTRGHRLERPRRLCRALALLAAALGILIFGTVFPASAQTVAIEPRYEAVGHFHEGLAPAKLNGAWGFIDRTGAWIVEPQYESVYRGADGRFGVKQNGLWGFISTAGTLVIEPRYKEIRPFSDGVARVRENDDGWFYIFPSGERESDQVFIDATDRVDGLADGQDRNRIHRSDLVDPRSARRPHQRVDAAAEGGHRLPGLLRGLCHRANRARVDLHRRQGRDAVQRPAHPRRAPFSQGLAAGSNGTKWGFFDKQAKTVIGVALDGARDFSAGVAPAALNGRWGYVDRKGGTAYPPQLEAAYSFREGYATIKQNGKFGFARVDDNGKVTIAIEPQYDDVFGFAEGLAPVLIGGKWGFISADDADYTLVRGISEITPN